MDIFQRLSDTYEIIGKIGSGGGGTVYKARHKRLDKEVVIKKIHTDIQDVVDCGAEANILKKLRHSFLPQVLDLFTISGNAYTVMDFIPGQSFQQLLDEKKRFPQKKIIKWAIQLSEALVYLHNQNPPIIHSDIKPANIMLTPSDDICLIDFNISSIFTGRGARTIGYSDGYSPPEQYQIYQDINKESAYTTVSPSTNDKTEMLIEPQDTESTELLYSKEISYEPYQQVAVTSEDKKRSSESNIGYALVDEKSDIYSLGATLYHLITGVKPAKATGQVVSLADFNIKISDGLIHIITKAMQKNPAKRYSSSSQLLKFLSNIRKLDKRYKRFMKLQELTVIIILLLFSASIRLIHYGRLQMSKDKQELYRYYIRLLADKRQDGNYEEMDVIYEDAVSLYPENIEAYYQRALSLYEQQDYETAIEYIEGMIMPDYNLEQSNLMKDIYFILGNCYFELSEYPDAITCFRGAITLYKSNSEYYRDYAISLARIGDTLMASEALEEAIKIGIADDSVYLIKGEIDLANRAYESGEDNFIECIHLSDEPYIKMRAYLKCEELYEAMIKAEIDSIPIEEIYLKKAKLLEEAKNTLPLDLTLGVSERLIQAYIDCGTYFNNNNYYRLAIEESKSMMDLNWESYNTYNNLVILYHKIGDIDNAFKIANSMISKYGEDYNIYKRLSYLELDVQSLLDNENRDYTAFQEYHSKAKDLYDKKMKNNKTDIEMMNLDQIMGALVEGGWFN